MDSLIDRVRPEDSVLLVIDMQNDFCHREGAMAKRGMDLSLVHAMIPRLQAFLGGARELDIPVVFTKSSHSRWTDSPIWMERSQEANVSATPACREGEWGEDLYEIEAGVGDRIIKKNRYNAFYGTNLELILRAVGAENVLFTGVMTNVCVESTAREAYIRGFRVVLIEDCCATGTAEEHAATVNNIGRYFGLVATGEGLLERLGTA